jgi:aspartyl-tRNA(Asn)/glutamyl-tRNA(Gln) amidotransferase subunit A
MRSDLARDRCRKDRTMLPSAKVDSKLAQIARLNPEFRAFTTVDDSGARRAAAGADRAEAEGRWLGLLHGMTVAIKDNIDTAGIRTAAGSALFADRVPSVDAVVVERLRRAGAVILGKAAMMELAFGVRSLDAVGGQVRNPWNPQKVAGGSSGGSAVAVALDLCEAALGSDTGGSIRVPAGFCGVTGLRPTHGLVPNRGSLPVSPTLDTIGPYARRVEDAVRVLIAIAGYDPEDPLSVDHPLPASLLDIEGDAKGLRIGLPRNFYFDDVDPEVASAVRGVAEVLAKAGATIIETDIRGAEETHRYATTIIYCDICAVHADALDNRRSMISKPIFERMIKGRDRTGVDYANALRFRETWKRTLRDLFGAVDVTLFPTSPYSAPPIVDESHLEAATAHATRFTFGGGLAGNPGLSVPCGMTRSGLPIGALIEAAWWNEAAVIRAGKTWQAATDWHLRRPPSAV